RRPTWAARSRSSARARTCPSCSPPWTSWCRARGARRWRRPRSRRWRSAGRSSPPPPSAPTRRSRTASPVSPCRWAMRPRAPRPAELAARAACDQAWQRRMYDSGWAGIAWPRAHGGRGATLMEQLVWCEEYARAGAPDISTLFVGLNHAGPTLVACGTEEQKAAHLPPILRGEVIWCQGFSEPNAGCDLASLQPRAALQGHALVVSGQKVWTSFAHVAQLQELLVRTDPEAPRHRGITWVICPMDA